MNDIAKVISQLERQRATIDRAIVALREVEGPKPGGATVSTEAALGGGRPVKRHMSEEGRRKIAEATRKRWADKRASEAAQSRKTAAATKAAPAKKTRRQGRTRKKTLPSAAA